MSEKVDDAPLKVPEATELNTEGPSRAETLAERDSGEKKSENTNATATANPSLIDTTEKAIPIDEQTIKTVDDPDGDRYVTGFRLFLVFV